MKRSVLGFATAVLAFGLGAIAAHAGTSPDVGGIPNFHAVSDTRIFRGGRPDLAGLQGLVALGVRTDIDLENDDEAITDEAAMATSLGLRFLSKPMSGFWAPDDSEVNDILGLVDNQNYAPVFVHCQHGQDRTGVIVALYRIFYMGWSGHDARDEMLQLGFHPILFPLNHYFEEKSGYED